MMAQVKLAFRNLVARKKRSWLTVISIAIGITAVVSLLSLGYGMRKAVVEQFEELGTDKIIVTAKGSFLGVGPAELTQQDLDRIKKLSEIDAAVGIIYKIARVKYGKKITYTWVAGVDVKGGQELSESIQNLDVKQGGRLKSGDKYKALAGYNLWTKDDLFGKPLKLGSKIEIEGKKFEVVGLLSQIGSPEDDASIWIPLETAREIFGEEDFTMIVAQVKQEVDPENAAERIKKELRRLRNVKEGEENFEVQTFQEILGSFNTILAVISAVLVGIASIALFVGGVGIANTMYTAVLERTREIGVMKATGARQSDIALIFLTEAGLLGVVGGIIGIALGIAIAYAVSYLAMNAGITFLKPFLSPALFLYALAFSFAIGSISGLAPALKAAKLEPVMALRYE